MKSILKYSLIALGAIGLTASVIFVVTDTKRANAEAEKIRTRAIDGTEIKNDELRRSYNELFYSKAENYIDLQMAKGELSDLNGKIWKIHLATISGDSILSICRLYDQESK